MDYLIGHLIGDYLLQTEWMAANKKSPGLAGWSACLLHCFLWTVAVLTCTGWWTLELSILVFISHIILDRTQIVAWYTKTVKKKQDFWLNVVCDNVLHLVFLWLIDKYVAR